MNNIIKRTTFCASLLMFSLLANAEEKNISANWKFHFGDLKNAQAESMSDSNWRELDLPHDWAYENGFWEDAAQGARGGYACGGIGWYRKCINLTANELKNSRHYIDFEGAYMNSEVWINGQYLGKRPYGYISFSYDMSKYLREGKNTIAVRLDNSREPSARWYHTCGIYGNVILRSINNIGIKRNGIWVKKSSTKGDLNVQVDLTSLKANADCVVKYTLSNNGIEILSSSQKSNLKEGDNSLSFAANVNKPMIWSPETPNLYTLDIKIYDKDNKEVDSKKINVGFRDIEWSAKKGFFLNGKQVKLRGVCDHLEAGPTGGYSTPELIRWRLQLLKDMGCNAVRTAHNPQIPVFYDICDEMGMLVMDEMFDGWNKKATFDYGMQAFDEWWERDLREFVQRDRNHPSVFLYSVGNETKGTIAKDLVRVCHEEDPSRLVTSGDSAPKEMDVYGVNGNSERKSFLDTYKPGDKAFIGTENPHTWQVRGYYRTQTWYRDKYPNDKQQPQYIPDLSDKEIFSYEWTSPENRRNAKQVFNSSYDNATVRVTARHILEYLRDKDWFSGSFRWTGFDYFGEAGFVHGGWPFHAFMGGAMDMAGFKKDLYYLYQSEWTTAPMVHILPHWTHPFMEKGTKIPVWVYTNGDEVELFLNGKSLGKKKKGKKWNQMQCEWKVPFEEGTLEAVAYKKGKVIVRTKQVSSGAPSQLVVTTDGTQLKADKEDVAVVSISECDSKGVMYPYGENRVYTNLSGAARILSFESGNPVDNDPNFLGSSRRCFFGLNRLFIQSTDKDGSKPVSIMLGSIIGDKQLKLSDMVSIDVKQIALRGDVKPANIKIYYTTNGKRPNLYSNEYTGAFKVKYGDTVKAVVYSGDKLMLEMSEQFPSKETLYWGNAGETSFDHIGDQAEFAKLDKAEIKKDIKDYNSNGYVVPSPKKGSITWYQENDGGDMKCIMKVRYNYSGNSDYKMALYNNCKFIDNVTFKNSKGKWIEVETPVTIHTGANNVKLTSLSDNEIAIDQIIVK